MDADFSRAQVTSLFEEQERLISAFFSNFDCKTSLEFVKIVLCCRGTVFFSGVGKSGFIANKIAMSFCSTGTKAMFMNPLDALHGDIGILSGADILVLLSKSGSTQELMQLIPVGKARGVKVVCVTCSSMNQMSKACHLHIHLPLLRELCIFNTAPVTSTILQLIFGDTITVALMQARKLTEEAYALNHPAGTIGRKLHLCVRDVMRTLADLPCVRKETTVKRALIRMSEGKLGCVFVVCAKGLLLGIFTDGDLRRCLDSHGGDLLDTSISLHMNPKPRITAEDLKLVGITESFLVPFPVQCLAVVKPEGCFFKLIGAISGVDATNCLT